MSRRWCRPADRRWRRREDPRYCWSSIGTFIPPLGLVTHTVVSVLGPPAGLATRAGIVFARLAPDCMSPVRLPTIGMGKVEAARCTECGRSWQFASGAPEVDALLVAGRPPLRALSVHMRVSADILQSGRGPKLSSIAATSYSESPDESGRGWRRLQESENHWWSLD